MGNQIQDWYANDVQWRVRQYEKLASLRAGFTLQKFKQELGDPVFETKDRARLYSTYRGRDYWVYTVSASNFVLAYAVTSCDKKFQPTFKPFGVESLVLNRSTLADLGDASEARYFIGNTANSYLFEITSSSNPTGYKQYAWGVNDACEWNMANRAKALDRLPQQVIGGYQGPLDRLSAETQEYRRVLLVNTYAETSPHMGFREAKMQEQIGVDRILTRTASN